MKTKNHQTANGNRMPSRVVRRNVTALILRSILFLAALAVYLLDKTLIQDNIYQIGFNAGSLLLAVIWIFFVIEMVSRFFPSDSESMGCQKQFARNFVPNDTLSTPIADMKRKHRKSVVIVAAVWIIPNAGIAALFFIGIIDAAALLIISLFYAVCDIVCILFYCPFQSLIMKNRCCVTCRIYNWDFLMMFTPLICIISFYSLSLIAIALILFIKWEMTFHKHPEWFCEETNKQLRCASCTEQLCTYKKHARETE